MHYPSKDNPNLPQQAALSLLLLPDNPSKGYQQSLSQDMELYDALKHPQNVDKHLKDLLKKSKDPKKLEKEFYRQLKDQEAGINKMSVSEYLKNRKTLNELTQEYGHTKARAILTKGGKAQREAREKLTNKIKDSVKVSLSKQGIAGRKAEEIATQKAEEQLKQLAALHDPDLIAGGSDKISRVGDASVNSSIGSQWSKDGRVETLNKAAEAKLKAEGPDAKMDIKLTRCK